MPFPLRDEIEMLQIDDHVGMAQRPRGSRAVPPARQRSFDAAREQCKRVGLVVAEDKRVEAQVGGTALGTEVAKEGFVGVLASR